MGSNDRSRFFTWTGVVFLAHLAMTLVASRARTGFFLFTVPIVTPVTGAESLVGRALWLLAADAGLVALALALGATSERTRHALSALALAGAATVLVVARDQVFVLGVSEPTAGGVIGVVQRPVFSAAFGGYVPWVVLGTVLDVVRSVAYAASTDDRVRLVARLVARAGTTAVLAYLATGRIFNVGGFAPLPGVEETLGLAAQLGLAALAVTVGFLAVMDWVALANLAVPAAGPDRPGDVPGQSGDIPGQEDAPR